MYISVIVDVQSSNVDQTYEYHVKDELACFLKVGERVKVEFTQFKRIVLGIIVDIYENKKYDGEVNDIIELLDFEPIINEKQMKLASFIKEDCICPTSCIFDLMIPNVLRLKAFKYIKVLDYEALDARLIEIFNKQEIIKWTPELDAYLSIIKNEINNNHLEIINDAKDTKTLKFIKRYEVNAAYYFENKNALRSTKGLEFLSNAIAKDPMTKDEILEEYGISQAIINSLVEKGFLKVTMENVSRIKDDTLILNQDNFVIDGNANIINNFKDNNIPYLYIPSSIKETNTTLISLINETLNMGKNVLIVTPEILSTYKYASMIKLALNQDVACLSSNLSDNEYYDYYEAIKQDDFRITVTSSKGVFMPYNNLGLIMMLDEDSDNYYNDQSPRYDMHRVLYYLAKLNNAKLVMTALNPSINSYCYSLKGYYKSVITKAINGEHNIEIVDLKEELKQGNSTFMSNSLSNSLEEAMKNKECSLLLVNNKNYSNYVICRECGNVPKCEVCNISLRYNQKLQSLICPACGRKTPYNNLCPSCGSNVMMYGGVGIESIKENINNNIPSARVEVLDSNNYSTFEKVYLNIINKNVDIVITTETYFKALDDKIFGFVGIINYDSVLKNPSFEALSKGYSLLSNAYEKLNDNGLMIVQTTTPNDITLVDFTIDDYYDFIKNEINNRKLLKIEPFYKVNRIVIKAPYEDMFKTGYNIKNAIIKMSNSKAFVMGPTYSKTINAVTLIIKHNLDNINDIYKKIYEIYQTSKVLVIFDKFPRTL